MGTKKGLGIRAQGSGAQGSGAQGFGAQGSGAQGMGRLRAGRTQGALSPQPSALPVASSTLPNARKRFGQNFLEPAWVEKVIRAIDPHSEDTFVEIGPGHGALTHPLAARAKRIFAYEIDRDLAAALRSTAPSNVEVVEGDVLSTLAARQPTPDVSTRGSLRVAGNLPYNIASPILFTLAALYASGLPIVDATVMLQREVANRLLAAPGGKEYGVLSVLMQHRAHVVRLLTLPPGAFRPSPKVHSTLVRLTLHPPAPAVHDEALFAALVGAVFTRRRKTLGNALLAFEKRPLSPFPQWLDPRRRPETVSVAEFARLANEIAEANS
jgi:16S rRNA (adenine1518-N6/adenine1519-N6)-dimethyltransferase